MLVLDRDITNLSGTPFAACSDSNNIYVISTAPDFRIYNWNGQQTNTTVTTLSNPTGIVLATAASAVVSYFSSNIDIINVQTNQRTNITSGAAATFAQFSGQQLAVSQASKVAIATRTGTGGVTKINVTTQALSTLSPSSLSGISSTCVIYNPDRDSFIVGTNSGKITEIDINGNVIKSFNIPNSPNVTSPTVTITGLSYYNNILVCTTAHGLMYFYNYATLALNYISLCPPRSGSGPVTTSLCDSASGLTLMAKSGTVAGRGTGVSEIYFNTPTPTIQTIFSDTITSPISVGIQASLNKAYVLFENSTANKVQLRIFTLTSPQITTETTRSQDPFGVDVAARILRLRDDSIGTAFVEIDQSVSSGTQSVNCTNDHSYIEVGYISGSPGRWDIREFQA